MGSSSSFNIRYCSVWIIHTILAIVLAIIDYHRWYNIQICDVLMPHFTILREPVSFKRRKILVQQEVRSSLKELGDRIIKRLASDIADWKEKPRFIIKVAVDANHWKIDVKYDKRQKIAKIYGWVDQGTGERGGEGSAYKIRPKRAKLLGFVVPHSPASLPFVPVPGLPSNAPLSFVKTKEVTHPGIYPRRFTDSLKWWLRSKEPGAFRSVVEAAVKRAYRKLT